MACRICFCPSMQVPQVELRLVSLSSKCLYPLTHLSSLCICISSLPFRYTLFLLSMLLPSSLFKTVSLQSLGCLRTHSVDWLASHSQRASCLPSKCCAALSFIFQCVLGKGIHEHNECPWKLKNGVSSPRARGRLLRASLRSVENGIVKSSGYPCPAVGTT